MIMVPRSQVSDAVQRLAAIDGSEVRIVQPAAVDYDDHKRQPFRSLNLTEYVPLAISLAAFATSILTLARSLVDLRKSSIDAKKATRPEASPQSLYVIVGKGDAIEVTAGT